MAQKLKYFKHKNNQRLRGKAICCDDVWRGTVLSYRTSPPKMPAYYLQLLGATVHWQKNIRNISPKVLHCYSRYVNIAKV